MWMTCLNILLIASLTRVYFRTHAEQCYARVLFTIASAPNSYVTANVVLSLTIFDALYFQSNDLFPIYMLTIFTDSPILFGRRMPCVSVRNGQKSRYIVYVISFQAALFCADFFLWAGVCAIVIFTFSLHISFGQKKK